MKWRIERVELFFYNGCENRWEMFEENTQGEGATLPGHPESFFRIQLQELLKTVRVAFDTKKSGDIEIPAAASSPAKDIPITMSQIDESLRKTFANYCTESLRQEGIHDHALETALEGLHTNNQFTLPKDSVSNLFSVIPIARDWDVFGWLHPMSTSTDRFLPDEYWWRTFVYRVGLQDKPAGAQASDDQPLDYHVFLQMLGDEKKKVVNGRTINPNPEIEIPYFHFAKSPRINRRQDGKGQSKMDGGEFSLYQAYSAVIDSVQKATAPTPHPAGKNGGQDNNYYVVYPVIACGYYHFFQLKVTPLDGDNGDPSAALQNCKAVFQTALPVGQYQYSVLKESLRELLVEIRLSAFQHYVTRWIADDPKRVLAVSDPDLAAVECFCELGPLINEMRAITTAGAAWAHGGTRGGFSRNDPIRDVLKPWAKFEANRLTPDGNGRVSKIDLSGKGDFLESSKYRIAEIPKRDKTIQLWLFHGQGDKFAEECFFGTNTRRLEEQYIAVKERIRRFWYAGRP